MLSPDNPDVRMTVELHPETEGLGFYKSYGIKMLSEAKKGTKLLSDKSIHRVPSIIKNSYTDVGWYIIEGWAFKSGQAICYINEPSIVNVQGEKEAINCKFSTVHVIEKDKLAELSVIAVTDLEPNTFLLLDYGKSNTVMPAEFDQFSINRLHIYEANKAYVNEVKIKSERGTSSINVCVGCGNVSRPGTKKSKQSKRAYNPDSMHCRMFCRNGYHFKGTRCEEDAIKFLPQEVPREVPLREFVTFGLNKAAKWNVQASD